MLREAAGDTITVVGFGSNVSVTTNGEQDHHDCGKRRFGGFRKLTAAAAVKEEQGWQSHRHSHRSAHLRTPDRYAQPCRRGAEWLIKNLYYGGAVEIYRTDGTNRSRIDIGRRTILSQLPADECILHDQIKMPRRGDLYQL